MYFHINLLKNNVVYYYNSYKRKSRNNKDEGMKNWNWYEMTTFSLTILDSRPNKFYKIFNKK